MNSLRVPTNKRTPRLRTLGVMAVVGLLLSGVLTWSGCATKESITESSSQPFSQPVIDPRLSLDDFAFPSAPPSLARGKEVFENNCLQCHAAPYWQQPKVQTDLTYTTPIDFYLMLTTGEAPPVTHPSDERRDLLPKVHAGADGEPLDFRTLSRDDRWAVLFYARHLAGFDDVSIQSQDGVALNLGSDVFGGNCAVCHGTRGFADGFLHTGRPSKHGVEGGKVHTGLFQPPPANFHDYWRMYNRTDAQIHKYIAEGIYPSAMPRWYGRMDKDKLFVFNDEMVWKLVRYVRQFSYDVEDLQDPNPPAGIILPSKVAQDYRPQTSMDMPLSGIIPTSDNSSQNQAGESNE